MIVTLDQIHPGMFLENDVRDLSGRLLLGKGEEVAERHLRIFRMWGISEADVLPARDEGGNASGDPLERVRTEQPERFREEEERVAELFRFTDRQHPLMAEMFAWTLRHRLREQGDLP